MVYNLRKSSSNHLLVAGVTIFRSINIKKSDSRLVIIHTES